MQINTSLLKSKLKAAAIHFLITGIIALVVMWFVNRYWYPYGTLKLLKGWNLFLVLLCCDVVLGPLLSLVVFNPAKSVKERLLDYAVIGVIQLAALSYGIHAVSQNRLLFLVFVADRYEVVTAGEMGSADLLVAPKAEWRDPGVIDHFVVVASVPKPTDRDYVDLVLSGLDGRDLQYFPERYREMQPADVEVLAAVKPFKELGADVQKKIANLMPDVNSMKSLGWLPVSYNREFWTMVVDSDTALPIRVIDSDPYVK